MSEKCDVIVIGAGILGCFAARHLARYDMKTVVLEQREDVCTEITRANSGIIYRGYDQHPASLKAAMCVRAAAHFPALCEELDVPFRTRGLLMLSFGPRADRVLDKKYRQGMQLGIDRLHLIDSARVYELEPGLRPGVQRALYSEDTYVADPWELGIAAFEQARENGVSFRFGERVCRILRSGKGFRVETENRSYEAARLLCCAGRKADVLWNMVSAPVFRIVPLAADYIVYDIPRTKLLRHIVSVEPENKGEGVTLIPTVGGNVLAGPTRREPDPACKDGYETSQEELLTLQRKARELLPGLSALSVIRSFGTVRPNPFYLDQCSSKSISDFLILEEEGLFSLAGVKTPGITCADELGAYITKRIVSSFSDRIRINEGYRAGRKGIVRAAELPEKERAALVREDPDYGRILCRCRDVTYAEVKEAIRRGAHTLDGIKRRTGAGMGRCQGGYCSERLLPLLAEETGEDITQICKNRPGSEMIKEARQTL